MTIRQIILKKLYPLLMKFSASADSKGKILSNSANIVPPVSFYDLKAVTNAGEEINFNSFRGKKVLLVNTASDCAYTSQFDELQTLYEANKDKLIILGFPANDFKEQEKGDDKTIAEFCKLNFGVTFPIMKKSVVIKSQTQNPVFSWLTHSEKNGWNQHQPDWNFSKYLINEEGQLTEYFGPSISPLNEKVELSLDNWNNDRMGKDS